MIDKDTVLFGSFAKNAGNSGCVIFNNAFKIHNLNALYKSFSVNSIEDAVIAAKTLNFKGFAVTMPFKKTVLKYVDAKSGDVEEIGAANTIINDNGVLTAHNTDFIAAKEILSENIQHKNLFILGDGGYAAAVKYAAKRLNLSYKTIARQNWQDIKIIKNSIVYNCTPVANVNVDNSNIYIDCIASTKTGKRLALIQAAHQYKLYTGLNFPNNQEIEERPRTIFCDIDGTLVKHFGNLSMQITQPLELLPGTIEAINDWEMKGYKIILVTGRRECMRKSTEQQLLNAGIFYDQLIMGVGSGSRVLINDSKLKNSETAYAITVVRNFGLNGLKT